MAPTITIRAARASDEHELQRLAQLDSAIRLSRPALVAEEHGELRAAIELGSGRVIANPFAPTASTVALLRMRRAELAAPAIAQPASSSASERVRAVL